MCDVFPVYCACRLRGTDGTCGDVAEFAKEAMGNQSLDQNEILCLRWAHDDPNPVAQDAINRLVSYYLRFIYASLRTRCRCDM